MPSAGSFNERSFILPGPSLLTFMIFHLFNLFVFLSFLLTLERVIMIITKCGQLRQLITYRNCTVFVIRESKKNLRIEQRHEYGFRQTIGEANRDKRDNNVLSPNNPGCR